MQHQLCWLSPASYLCIDAAIGDSVRSTFNSLFSTELMFRCANFTPKLSLPPAAYVSIVLNIVTEPGCYANHPLYELNDLVLKLSLDGSCVAGSVTLLCLRKMRAPA